MLVVLSLLFCCVAGDHILFEVNFVGLYEVNKAFQNSEDCEAACRGNTTCVYWSFRVSDLLCSIAPTFDYALSDSTYISGVKAAGEPKCAVDAFAAYHGNDIYGNTFNVSGSLLECCDVCSKTPGCVLWTFKPSAHECWLKSAGPQRTEASDLISGWMTAQTCKSFGVLRDRAMNQSLSPAVLRFATKSGIGSAEECGKQCLGIYGCVAAEHHNSTRICLLSNVSPLSHPEAYLTPTESDITLLYL